MKQLTRAMKVRYELVHSRILLESLQAMRVRSSYFRPTGVRFMAL